MTDHVSGSAGAILGRIERSRGRPLRAMIEISDRCNEVCVHCYQEQGLKGEMSTEQVKRVMDELAELGVLVLTISGGEVFFQGAPVGIRAAGEGEATLFFRPQDTVLVSEGPGLEGTVTSSRRLAGNRIAEIDVGNPACPHHVEVGVPLDGAARNGTALRFRPERWKIFAA